MEPREGQTNVLFAVGNGADADNRSDALQVDQMGNLTASGKVIASGQDLLMLIAALQTQVDTLTPNSAPCKPKSTSWAGIDGLTA